jgi:SRSO17 transposase
VKKGDRSAGVQRQDTGTVGKQEHCQVAVFLAYAVAGGVALVDRELYLPKSWTEDRVRCRAAGVPEEVASRPSRSWARPCLSELWPPACRLAG